MLNFVRASLVVSGLALASLSSHRVFAETIVIPVGQQSNTSVKLPKKGTSKQAVIAAFGEPLSSKAPVGKPPIATWNYADFSVYFEYDHVVHAVANHKPAAAPAPEAPAAEPDKLTQ